MSRVGSPRLAPVIATVFAVAVITVVTSLLVTRDGGGTTPAAPDSSTTQTTDGTATTSPTQPAPSAAQDLAPFFAAAVKLDQQLHIAAAAINAVGPPWERITAAVANKVGAADLGPVSRSIPAGLPHDLQRAAVLVLSDLASRRMAMESFTVVAPVLPDDTNAAHQTNAQLLTELANGHAAAVRFDSDLAAAQELAAHTPPIASVPSGSRLTAETLIRVEYVRVANAGCDARGGAVLTRLPEVRWQSVPEVPEAEGTVGAHHIAFNADLRRDGTWDVYLFAC